MNPARDPDPILSAWLDEGPTDLPDVTRRAIVAALPTTNQRRRPIWAPWRFSPMSAPLRAALAVLVAAVVIGGGIYLLGPRGGGPGVDVTPSPSASPSPVPTPTPPPPPLPFEGVLEPGLYSYDGTKVRVILNVPAGWEGGGFFVSRPESEAPNGASLGFRQPTAVYTDPCDENTVRPLDSTFADLVNALADLPHVTDSAQEDVTLSGFSGTHLSFVVDTEGIDASWPCIARSNSSARLTTASSWSCGSSTSRGRH